MDARVYDMPTSVILVNGKCGNYFKIITSLENENCNEAIKRIVSKIDLDQINAKIDELKEASDLQKSFLKKY